MTNKPLRILYLHQYFAAPTGIGGTRSYEFARRLVASGHTVSLITSTALLPEPYNTLTEVQTIDFDGISVIAIPQPYSNEMGFAQRIRAFFAFALKASIQTTRQPADVIFATSTPLTIAIPGIIGRLRHRKPMVFEVRDLWPELPIAVGALKNPVFRLSARLLEWVAYHQAKHIIALSPGMAEGVMRRGISHDRVTVIPNSSDVNLFNVPSERGTWVRERLKLTPTQPLIVYTGTFGIINEVGYLVDVAREMLKINPDIYFLLVGDGKQKQLVETRAESVGVLDQNLAIWSSLPKMEIVDVLAAATVATSVVLPIKAIENNSANKFFDALAAGKPIAINYGGWQKEILEENSAGIYLPYDDIHMAAIKLAEFSTDEIRLGLAQQAAKVLATTQFSRDHLYEKFEHVIRAASSLPNPSKSEPFDIEVK